MKDYTNDPRWDTMLREASAAIAYPHTHLASQERVYAEKAAQFALSILDLKAGLDSGVPPYVHGTMTIGNIRHQTSGMKLDRNAPVFAWDENEALTYVITGCHIEPEGQFVFDIREQQLAMKEQERRDNAKRT